MRLRKERKLDSGSSNIQGRVRGKFVRLDQSDPQWLGYFSLPKEQLMKYMKEERKANPNPFRHTIDLYRHIKGGKKDLQAHAIEIHPVLDDIKAESQYTKGQSNLAIDFQKGITAIEQLNLKSSPPSQQRFLQKVCT